jgi:hypothetical protein
VNGRATSWSFHRLATNGLQICQSATPRFLFGVGERGFPVQLCAVSRCSQESGHASNPAGVQPPRRKRIPLRSNAANSDPRRLGRVSRIACILGHTMKVPFRANRRGMGATGSSPVSSAYSSKTRRWPEPPRCHPWLTCSDLGRSIRSDLSNVRKVKVPGLSGRFSNCAVQCRQSRTGFLKAFCGSVPTDFIGTRNLRAEDTDGKSSLASQLPS